jgi:hypothetical protein
MTRYPDSVRTLLLLAAMFATTAAAPPAVSWRALQPGVELAQIERGTGMLYVVRIDPSKARLRLALASEKKSASRTAGEWCRQERLAVAINAGMFQTDQRSNVGYMRDGQHLNNGRWNDYRSVLALAPTKKSLPPLRWLDLTGAAPPPGVVDGYAIVIQNLRLIALDEKGNGKNVWAPNERRWSETAIAADAHDRLLFIFSRAPYMMRDFNQLLLDLPLGITRAMHVEGGPEASLSIHVPGLDLDLCGSYETGFRPDESNTRQWPIPNVLGVAR